MSRRQDIENDPYAYADADRIFELLKPWLRLLRRVPLRVRQLEFAAAEHRVRTLANESEEAYFNCLRALPPDVEIDYGKHPAKFIAAQLRFSELRDSYVLRRITARLSEIFERLITEQEVR